MTTHDWATTRGWVDDGTKLLLGAVGALADDELDAATALPGWTRRHLVAHVHHNAEALRRLVHWARTGERTPMYADPAQRAADIEAGAALPVTELRALVHGSADALAADLDALPEVARSHQVATAKGRTVPAGEICWMRTREVAVHAVDLGTGLRFADLPDDLNAALVADAVGTRVASGQAAALAGWLTGRTGAPELGPWL